MNRQEKEIVIKSVKSEFENSEAAFVIGMQGMTVESVQKLRKDLHARKGSFKVTKNTLLKIATKDIPGLTDLEPYFRDQVAIIFADSDAPAIAKIIFNATKENAKIKLIGGALQSKVINSAQVEYLATLPAREVLLAQVCGTLQAPISAYVRVLHQLIARLLYVLKQIEQKKQ